MAYIFRFVSEDDLMKVRTGGAWVVGGLVLSSEELTKGFRASKIVVTKACVLG